MYQPHVHSFGLSRKQHLSFFAQQQALGIKKAAQEQGTQKTRREVHKSASGSILPMAYVSQPTALGYACDRIAQEFLFLIG